MNYSIVALVGVSGVGKTTFVNELQSMAVVETYSASDIIKFTLESKTGRKWTKEDMRLADTNIMQNALVSGFKHIRENTDTPIILDAHTIIDKNDTFDTVEPSLFHELGIELIVHLKEPPEEILRRRLNDKSRERPKRTVDQIKFHQSKSIEQAVKIGIALGVPSIQIDTGKHDTLAKLIYPNFKSLNIHGWILV